MKQFKLLIILSNCILLFGANINAQISAVTELGDTIFVYDNGTWSFERGDNNSAIDDLAYLEDKFDLDTIKAKLIKPTSTTKEVKNTFDQFVIKYDDKTWKRVPTATLNEEAEFAFEHRKSDIWCVVISEETPIQMDKLYLIAKKSIGDNSGTEPIPVKTELRNVNGSDVIRGVIKADFSGITFIFDTYYFSNETGSVQFTVWTSENVWKRSEEEILEFLNGFVAN